MAFQWLFFTCFAIINGSQEWAAGLCKEREMSLNRINSGYTGGVLNANMEGTVGLHISTSFFVVVTILRFSL